MINGKEITRLRERAGLSIKALAAKAEIDPGTVARAEKSLPIVTNKLEAIAGALGLPPAYFFS
jgi:transcriptional regulator with XRE-family HTH domain